MTTIRVASYNTRDFLEDRAAAARVVRALRPDVLCLQEVPRRLGSHRRVARFAAECELRWSGRHRGSGGTTIFTSGRVAVEQTRHYRLHVARLQRTRGFALARVRAEGSAPLAVASVHLSLDRHERAEHARSILAALDVAGDVVLAGDLNEDETGDAWQLLAGPLRLVSPLRPTFPAHSPHRMLDVVFASPSVEVLPERAVSLPVEDLRAASDHLPTWVDLRLRPAGRAGHEAVD